MKIMKFTKTGATFDFRLYDHFTKVFWKKVHAQGPDFMNEVSHFKQINSQIMIFVTTESIKQGRFSLWNNPNGMRGS